MKTLGPKCSKITPFLALKALNSNLQFLSNFLLLPLCHGFSIFKIMFTSRFLLLYYERTYLEKLLLLILQTLCGILHFPFFLETILVLFLKHIVARKLFQYRNILETLRQFHKQLGWIYSTMFSLIYRIHLN